MGEPTVTVRRDVLRSWLKVSGHTQAHLAKQLSVSKGRISQLLNSDQEPSARLIASLLHLTNLPFNRLFTIKQRKLLHQRLRSRAGSDDLRTDATDSDKLVGTQ